MPNAPFSMLHHQGRSRAGATRGYANYYGHKDKSPRSPSAKQKSVQIGALAARPLRVSDHHQSRRIEHDLVVNKTS